MANEDLPDEVSRFIISFIDSVEQLNVLLLLYRDPSREWSAAEITSELRSTEGSIGRRLEDLYSRQVLDVPKAFRHTYTVREDLRGAVAQLEVAYRERPLRIIELIYSQPPMALRVFADAFRIRKDEK